VTERAVFSDSEWGLLVRLPRWVVGAASAVQPDNARRTAIEREAGFVAVADGREMGNAFVARLARDAMDRFDDRDDGVVTMPVDFSDVDGAIAAVLERVAQAIDLLAQKSDAQDALVYRRWLLDITEIVIRAARSHDVLGLGGELVTKLERDFRDRLVQILQVP
jgi:hypothetical protein